MQKGIDISKWQGNIDFKKVKNDGIQFVILREGYRQTIDPKFLEYTKGAQGAGIPIHGVYHFLYSINTSEVLAEAKSCIENVKKAGLGKDTIIFMDFEYDTVTQAKNRGVNLGKAQCIEFTNIFNEYVIKQGYRAGVYSNIDYYKNLYDKETISKYVFWLADYSGEADYKCTYHQYTSSGKVSGISGNVDMDYFYGSATTPKKEGDTKMTEAQVRQKIVDTAAKYIGTKEYSTNHKDIINTFNNSGLCSRYKMTLNDAWCATFVGAMAIKCGYQNIIPIECSCMQMISIAKNKGIWKETDSYKPTTGDIIMYDWQDSGAGDNTGVADHVGIVVSVSGSTIKVIEGNMNNTVGYRNLAVNGRYIRGYILPKYQTKANGQTATTTPPTTTTPAVTINKTKKWSGEVTADYLNVRTWPGTSNPQVSFSPLKKGTVVDVCDTVNNWYYIKYQNKYGFVHPDYIVMQQPKIIVDIGVDKKKSIEEIAKEVIDGKWGNGDDRKAKLKSAGYDAAAVQKKVNELLKGQTATKEITYTVKKGDTLTAIAAKYKTTYKEIASYNNISNPNVINVGQVLRIPTK